MINKKYRSDCLSIKKRGLKGMCGILGGNYSSWNYRAGLEAMRYRGPDGIRIKAYENFTLAFVRLSIRDLTSAAMQPMISADDQVAIVFNGELYGIEELRTELELKYVFKTTSDTEVLLNSYLEYGDGFIDRIDGMFAIAIYDKRKGTVTLYRDRVGIKPLYYLYDGRNFCFASELKGIINTCDNFTYDYDVTALYDYFSYEYIPEPKTMYKNVFKLEPAHKLIFDLNENKLSTPQRYWSLEVNPYKGITRNRTEICEQVKELIAKEIRKQLVADVEVGTFFSGGIDSSIITIVANEFQEGIKAFSVGFEIARKKDRYFDEREYAGILAKKYNIDWISEVFMPKDLAEIYNNVVHWYDEPYAAYSCYPTYFVSGLAKQHGVSVVLAGDGGDEIFGGYTRYKNFAQYIDSAKRNNQGASNFYYKYICEFDKKLLGRRFLEDIQYFGLQADWCRDIGQTRILHRLGIAVPKDYDDFWYFRKHDNAELPPITRAQVIDFNTYLPSVCLQKVDRATMQWSLEARVPLCSREIIEFAFSLTEEERCLDGELKGLLKNAYEGIIPKEVLYKIKKGFTFPDKYGDIKVWPRLNYRKELFHIYIPEYRNRKK